MQSEKQQIEKRKISPFVELSKRKGVSLKLKEYVKIIEVNPSEVNNYLDKGWEIIDKTKTYLPPDETKLTYHMGYPAKKRIEDLLEIISEYEKYGFKEKLFEIIANENGEDVNSFTDSSPFGMDENSKTAQYMSWYESTVKNKKVYYGKKPKIGINDLF